VPLEKGSRFVIKVSIEFYRFELHQKPPLFPCLVMVNITLELTIK